MTDKAIIKKLQELLETMCYEGDLQRSATVGNALDLINRQKAEIERLQTENKLLVKKDISTKYPNCVLCSKGVIFTKSLEDYDELIGDISAEAIKYFAERAREKAQYKFITTCVAKLSIPDINDLEKELLETKRETALK